MSGSYDNTHWWKCNFVCTWQIARRLSTELYGFARLRAHYQERTTNENDLLWAESRICYHYWDPYCVAWCYFVKIVTRLLRTSRKKPRRGPMRNPLSAACVAGPFLPYELHVLIVYSNKNKLTWKEMKLWLFLTRGYENYLFENSLVCTSCGANWLPFQCIYIGEEGWASLTRAPPRVGYLGRHQGGKCRPIVSTNTKCLTNRTVCLESEKCHCASADIYPLLTAERVWKSARQYKPN